MPRTPDPGALQYDLRADHVTRRRQPASRAFMPTLRKRLGHGRSAYAHLAGSTRLHLHHLSPGARTLAPELGAERATKLSSPTSMPISSDDSGNATLSRSTEKHTYQWFTSRLIVTVLISPSTGRCSLTLTRPVPWIRNFPSSSHRQPSP